ncbi:hypothetical protein ACFOEY_11620 [Paracandidimonas soli]
MTRCYGGEAVGHASEHASSLGGVIRGWARRVGVLRAGADLCHVAAGV